MVLSVWIFVFQTSLPSSACSQKTTKSLSEDDTAERVRTDGPTLTAAESSGGVGPGVFSAAASCSLIGGSD